MFLDEICACERNFPKFAKTEANNYNPDEKS